MRLLLRRAGPRVLVLLLLGPLTGGLAEPVAVPDADRDAPVLWVHGIYPTLPAGMDYAVWEASFDGMADWGWEEQYAFGYYGCDRYRGHVADYVDVGHHGPSALRHDGTLDMDHEANRCGDGIHGHDTSLEHIAHHWAWAAATVLDGRCGNVIAHSMGGLVVRHALMAVDAGDPGYPRTLCIATVMTLGTPHAGTAVAEACPEEIVRSCTQMRPGSPFIARLEAEGSHPGKGPSGVATQWLAVASQADLFVPWRSQIGMEADAVTVYHWGARVGHTRLPTGNYLDHGTTSGLPTVDGGPAHASLAATGRESGPLLLADHFFTSR